MNKKCTRCGGTGKEPDHRAIAEYLKRKREQRNLTQKTVAERLGISPQYLCDLESNRRDWYPELQARFLKVL